MKSVNLYVLSNMKNMRLYAKYYSALTGEEERVYKPHEAESLFDFITACKKLGLKICDFDGYYYGFIIPRIGKEFDILKISEQIVLNIELKSWVGDKELVLEQLIKNKFYLAHINKKRLFYTFNSDTKTLYKLTEQNKLEVANMLELVEIMKQISGEGEQNINQLFEVSQFIVSPTKNPERFIGGEYFLTQQQQQIKRQTIEGVKNNRFVKISGSAGTGKTLLLYDLAITLAKDKKVCFMQPGKMVDAQKKIARAFKNLTFCQGEVDKIDFFDYDVLLVDESQRYSENFFNSLLYSVKKSRIKCIFAFEKIDVFTSGERTVSSSRMAKIRGLSFALSGRIRVNVGISSFIQALFDKSKPPKQVAMDDVCVYCSNTHAQTDELARYLKQKGYKIISDDHTLSCKREKSRGDLPLNDVYGKEFDKVGVIISGEFVYNSKNKLCYKNTGAFAENLFCAITRVREKLCIIVENNEPVLERALKVKQVKK